MTLVNLKIVSPRVCTATPAHSLIYVQYSALHTAEVAELLYMLHASTLNDPKHFKLICFPPVWQKLCCTSGVLAWLNHVSGTEIFLAPRQLLNLVYPIKQYPKRIFKVDLDV